MVEKFKQLSLIVLLVEIIFSSDLYAQSFKEKLKQAVKQEYNSAKQRYNSRNQYRNNSYRYNNNSKQYQNNSTQYNSKDKQKDSNNTEDKAKSQDEAVLTVFGFGKTKDEATKIALRSAIEQAFGAFVSSNTQLLNDSLISDEIATVSSGNIKHYEYISEQKYENGYSVSLKATVSINKLIRYAESKGSEIEFGGDTFAMNIAMYELNKKNEESVINHLFQEIVRQVPYLYDYNISASNPKKNSKGKWEIPITVTIYTNKNANNIYDLILNTFNSISLSQKDFFEYRNNYNIKDGSAMTLFEYIDVGNDNLKHNDYSSDKTFYFRNNKTLFIQFTNSFLVEAFYQTIAFKITDNLREYIININNKRDFANVFLNPYGETIEKLKKYCNSYYQIEDFPTCQIEMGRDIESSLFSHFAFNREGAKIIEIRMKIIYDSLDEIKKINNFNILPTHKSILELKDE